jgi:hypothetical protein
VQGATSFYLNTLSRIYYACGQLQEEALTGLSHIDATKASKVARAALKCPVDRCCESVLTISERLMRIADFKNHKVSDIRLLGLGEGSKKSRGTELCASNLGDC